MSTREHLGRRVGEFEHVEEGNEVDLDWRAPQLHLAAPHVHVGPWKVLERIECANALVRRAMTASWTLANIFSSP